MLELEDVRNFVYATCENVSTSKGGTHFHARCPLCMDSEKSKSKKRFHLEYTDDNCKYHCFNCDQKGDFYGLYSTLKSIDRDKVWKLYHNFNDIKSIWKHHQTELIVEQPKQTDNFNWILSDCLTVNDVPDGYIQTKYLESLKQFIEHRKINIDVFVACRGIYQNRIIIPIYEGSDIVFFQARAVDGRQPKYLNSVTSKQDIIFNKDNFVKDDPIFVTEGVLDAQSIGNNGTTCLDREIIDDFIEKLFEYSDKLYIVLDNDQSGMESLRKLIKTSKYRNKLNYFLINRYYKQYKDINMLVMNTDIEVQQYIINNSYSMGKTAAKLMMEKWRNEDN